MPRRRARHCRSVEGALELLWEELTPDERHHAGVRGEWGEFKNYRDYLDTVNNELNLGDILETARRRSRWWLVVDIAAALLGVGALDWFVDAF